MDVDSPTEKYFQQKLADLDKEMKDVVFEGKAFFWDFLLAMEICRYRIIW